MKMNKKYLWNILLILAITAVAMYFSLKDNFEEIVTAIAGMNPFMLVLVVCWGMLYNAVWGVSYQVLGSRYKKKYSLLEGITVALVGTFFAGITPSSTGGQFGQIYVLKKQGISYSDGASLLWADFIIYQTTMMIYVTILFALRFSHYANLSAWFWMVFVGYLVNLVVVLGLYTMALFPSFYIKVVGWAAKWLHKVKFIKNPDEKIHSWMAQVTNFTVEIKKLSQDKTAILECMFVTFLRLSLYYSLPYVIAKSLGIDIGTKQIVDVLALSSFVTMANSFIPIPGASGGTELVFTLLFSGMMGSLTGAVLLLWRVSSYYIPLIAGAVIFITFKNHYDSIRAVPAAASAGAAQTAQTDAPVQTSAAFKELETGGHREGEKEEGPSPASAKPEAAGSKAQGQTDTSRKGN